MQNGKINNNKNKRNCKLLKLTRIKNIQPGGTCKGEFELKYHK
jgi:hypothetical protein